MSRFRQGQNELRNLAKYAQNFHLMCICDLPPEVVITLRLKQEVFPSYCNILYLCFHTFFFFK